MADGAELDELVTEGVATIRDELIAQNLALTDAETAMVAAILRVSAMFALSAGKVGT